MQLGKKTAPLGIQTKAYQNAKTTDWSKLLGIGAAGVGLAGLGMDMFTRDKLNYSPSLTEGSVRSEFDTLISGLRRRSAKEASGIAQDVSSQYIARGLGTGSGNVLNDITDAKSKLAGEEMDAEADMNQQLMEMLKYIDARDLQLAQYEQQQSSSKWQDLASIGLQLGMTLL